MVSCITKKELYEKIPKITPIAWVYLLSNGSTTGPTTSALFNARIADVRTGFSMKDLHRRTVDGHCQTSVHISTHVKELTPTDPLGVEYDGFQNTTENGRACQKWSQNFPHVSNVAELLSEDHNYCRNPDAEAKPWCYTMDPNIRWEYCAVIDKTGRFKKYFTHLCLKRLHTTGGEYWKS